MNPSAMLLPAAYAATPPGAGRSPSRQKFLLPLRTQDDAQRELRLARVMRERVEADLEEARRAVHPLEAELIGKEAEVADLEDELERMAGRGRLMAGDKNFTALRPAGVAIITPLDGGKVTMQDSLCCAHCGCHFPVRPGSGKARGMCFRCMGPICGPKCVECVPVEVFLDNLENGRPPGYRPIIARTS